mmetsp:Transcript_22763/g.29046  ORF Transcript_22763/g.29046 Transcript_22763/m.29046 type:complete len:678 (-) Transcript_22763:1022-3055(-)|eukprot:CAMPEP_0204863486 /NCGR_PEP_ID=MMETSP1348-20121228/3348_1 /ASSEMBLY_ACC=CAM_ASM_000700 /TAXON_ID=215587 /ORGANISM="Aplanochytrium stocchinoi, Strain GSBS06" /LENGTH=677 /DNA_ID=CAMNT_0052013823 /DNA_START=167 /DNA_END=2203 /DNA_ORIENTATION=-
MDPDNVNPVEVLPQPFSNRKRDSLHENKNDKKAPKLDLGCLSGPTSPRSYNKSTGITPRLKHLSHWTLPKTNVFKRIEEEKEVKTEETVAVPFSSLDALADVSNKTNLEEREKYGCDSGYESDSEQEEADEWNSEEEDAEVAEIESLLRKAKENQLHISEVVAFNVENVASTLKNLHQSSSPTLRKQALSSVRLWLSLPSQNIFFKPYMVKFLVPFIQAVVQNPHIENDVQMCRDALWCLTYLSTGRVEEKRLVLDAVPHLLQLLRCETKELVDQGIWTLGELASSTKEIRDKMVEYGTLPELLQMLNSSKCELNLKRKAAWVLSCLCEGDYASQDSLEARIHTTVVRLVREIVDPSKPIQEVVHVVKDLEAAGLITEIAWTLSYFSARRALDLNAFVNDSFIHSFCCIFAAATDISVPTQSLNVDLIIPVARLLGNILAAGNCDFGNLIIRQHGFVKGFIRLLSDEVLQFHRGLTKEAAFISAGVCMFAADDKITERIIVLKILPEIFTLFCHSMFDVQQDVIQSFFNIAYRKDKYLFKAIFTTPGDPVTLMKVMTKLLVQVEDDDFRMKVLDFLEVTLENIKQPMPGIDLVQKARGIDAIEYLCYGNLENHTLGARASGIIDRYFGITYKDSPPLEPDLNWHQTSHRIIPRGERSSLVPAWMKDTLSLFATILIR